VSRWASDRFKNLGRLHYRTSFGTDSLRETKERERKELSAMASVNLVILMGNLGGDPDLKYTQSGKAFCKFSLATTDEWSDAQGQRQKKTEWHRIMVWGKAAENCAKYLKKGSSAYIEGKLSTSKYRDPETGQDRYSTEIIADDIKFLSSPQRHEAEPGEPSFRYRNA
jgi:single-strand DNA-binding protein